MPVKKSSLGIQNPVTSANEKLRSLERDSTELISAVMVESEFPTANFLQVIKEERREVKNPR